VQAETIELRAAIGALHDGHARHARAISRVRLDWLPSEAERYRPREGGTGLFHAKPAPFGPLPLDAIADAERLQHVATAEEWLHAAIAHTDAARKRVTAYGRGGARTAHGPEDEEELLRGLAAAVTDGNVAAGCRTAVCSQLEGAQDELRRLGCAPFDAGGPPRDLSRVTSTTRHLLSWPQPRDFSSHGLFHVTSLSRDISGPWR